MIFAAIPGVASSQDSYGDQKDHRISQKVLAEVGKPVTKFDKELADLCSDMFETMYDAEGVGLAAPQIGLNLRLFVMDCEGVKLIAANPEIISTEGEQSGQEGCLSVGKIPAVVVRPQKARLHATRCQRPVVRTRGRRLCGPGLYARDRPLRRRAVYRSPG